MNMNEHFDENGSKTPENLEDRKYEEWKAATEKEDQLVKEVNDVFANTPDRAEAERIVMSKYEPLLDAAFKESMRALTEWLEAIRTAHESEG